MNKHNKKLAFDIALKLINLNMDFFTHFKKDIEIICERNSSYEGITRIEIFYKDQPVFVNELFNISNSCLLNGRIDYNEDSKRFSFYIF